MPFGAKGASTTPILSLLGAHTPNQNPNKTFNKTPIVDPPGQTSKSKAYNNNGTGGNNIGAASNKSAGRLMFTIPNNVGNPDVLPSVANNTGTNHPHPPSFVPAGNPRKLQPTSPPISTNQGTNLPDYTTTPVDDLLDSVYRDHLHQNDGSHLNGGIPTDGKWQEYYRRLLPFPSSQYDLPKGKVGKLFLSRLTIELNGVRERKWNSEKPLLFALIVFQKTTNAKRSGDIRYCLLWRLKSLEEGEYEMLVGDTFTYLSTHLQRKRGGDMNRGCGKIFHNQVLRRDLRGAVRFLTKRSGGGVLERSSTCTRTG